MAALSLYRNTCLPARSMPCQAPGRNLHRLPEGPARSRPKPSEQGGCFCVSSTQARRYAEYFCALIQRHGSPSTIAHDFSALACHGLHVPRGIVGLVTSGRLHGSGTGHRREHRRVRPWGQRHCGWPKPRCLHQHLRVLQPHLAQGPCDVDVFVHRVCANCEEPGRRPRRGVERGIGAAIGRRGRGSARGWGRQAKTRKAPTSAKPKWPSPPSNASPP